MNRFFAIFVVAAMMLVTTVACDEEEVIPQLPTSSGALDNSSYNTLSFDWERVAGAVQYGCSLADADGKVIEAKVAQLAKVTFTGLEPSTDYVLTVTPYGAVGVNADAEPFLLYGRTSDIIVIDAPSITFTQDLNTVSFSWDNVTYAQSYAYRLVNVADNSVVGSGSTDLTSVSFNLTADASYIFYVQAVIDQAGYASSAEAAEAIDFIYTEPEMWRVTGTYYSEYLDNEWECTLVAYKDGSYSILDWYGVPGYNFSFSIGDDGSFNLPDDTKWDSGWPYLNTGLSDPSFFYVYIWDDYCGISLEDKEIWLCLYNTDYTYDSFTWGSGVNVAELAGTYAAELDDEWDKHYDGYTVTVTVTGDNTVRIADPFGWEDDSAIVGTVDPEAGTITFQPQIMLEEDGDVYMFANQDDVAAPVIGSIVGNTITLTDFSYFYEYYGPGNWSAYMHNTKLVLTRQ